ncbi:MAG: NfeD family protein [Planctomycetota bacterium]
MNPVPILLMVASLALLAIEVIIVSFGAISLIAIACAVGGIMLAFDESATYGWSLVALAVVGGPLTLRAAFQILPKIPFARGFYLRAPDLTRDDRQAADSTDRSLVGTTGEATSPLRPAGTALLAGARHDVVTRGKMLPSGAAVRVVEVSGNRIIVEPIESASTPEGIA